MIFRFFGTCWHHFHRNLKKFSTQQKKSKLCCIRFHRWPYHPRRHITSTYPAPPSRSQRRALDRSSARSHPEILVQVRLVSYFQPRNREANGIEKRSRIHARSPLGKWGQSRGMHKDAVSRTVNFILPLCDIHFLFLRENIVHDGDHPARLCAHGHSLHATYMYVTQAHFLFYSRRRKSGRDKTKKNRLTERDMENVARIERNAYGCTDSSPGRTFDKIGEHRTTRQNRPVRCFSNTRKILVLLRLNFFVFFVGLL